VADLVAGSSEASGSTALDVRTPHRLHPLSPVLGVIDRNVVAPGILALGSGGWRVLAVLLLAVLVLRAISWSRRTYVLDGGVLRITSGVLSRDEQLVPADRIQQVTVVQALQHRLLGVAELRVEVAGGGRESGVELAVLSSGAASRLRDALLVAPLPTAPDGSGSPADGTTSSGPSATGGRAPLARPVVRLSLRHLAVAGVTGSELFVLFAFVASAVQLLADAPGLVPSFDRTSFGRLSAPTLALVLLGLLAVWLGSAVGASVLRNGRYALDLVGGELHLARGVLDRKQAVLPLARVQSVQITATPLRRPLGYVSLRVQSASAGADQEDRRVTIPILATAEVPRVLELLLPGATTVPPLLPAPPAARRRAIVRATAPVAVLAALAAAVASPWGWLALGLLGPAVGFGVLTHRGLGHAVTTTHLRTRTGAVVRRTVVMPLVKAQSTRVRASPMQRRAGLATCVVDLAGPGRRPRAVDVAVDTATGVATTVVTAIGGR
jgi:putative membrane protein